MHALPYDVQHAHAALYREKEELEVTLRLLDRFKKRSKGMTFTIKDDKLQSDDVKIEFRSAGKKNSGKMDPKFLVVHYTAGTSFSGDLSILSDKSSAKVSCHLIIGPKGEVGQVGTFKDALWHAGESSWRGFSGLNRHSIGIEVTSPGWLTADGKTWKGKKLVDGDPWPFIAAQHKNPKEHAKLWAGFNEIQIERILEIGELLMDHYNLTEAVGHDQIAPHRKIDPGPCCPDSVFHRLNGNAEDEVPEDRPDLPTEGLPKKRVSGLPAGEKLNFRTEPGGLIVGSLPEGTVVEMITSQGDWEQVRTPWTKKVGWVYGTYLTDI